MKEDSEKKIDRGIGGRRSTTYPCGVFVTSNYEEHRKQLEQFCEEEGIPYLTGVAPGQLKIEATEGHIKEIAQLPYVHHINYLYDIRDDAVYPSRL